MTEERRAQNSTMERTVNSEKKTELFSSVGHQVTDVEATAEDGDGTKVVDQIESLCMNCEENGMTRMLLTKIPYFREIILMSFYCEHCHFKNTEIQAAGEIQKHGTRFTLKLEKNVDLQRQVVKSDTAVIRVEDLDLEIPPGRGRLSNIEGILTEVLDDLGQDQPRRKEEHPDVHTKIEDLLNKLQRMADGSSFPFTVTLDDTAGNSSLEPSPGDSSGKYTRTEYQRNPQQNASLGLTSEQPVTGELTPADQVIPYGMEENPMDGVDILEGKMYTMPCECPGCGKAAAMNMQMVNIPYFKQVLISAVVCVYCEYRTNEVKTGGEIPELGHRITLQVNGLEDLKRDILKSETCMLKVPECGIEVQPGTMGGRFTTVEGLLTQMREDLHTSIFDVGEGGGGDSMSADQKGAWDEFFTKLDKAIKAEMKYTIVLEDPLANSYVQNYLAPEPDPQIQEEDYERTAEEEEELGLADMRTHQNEDGEYVREEAAKKVLVSEKEKTSDATLSAAAADLSLNSSKHSNGDRKHDELEMTSK